MEMVNQFDLARKELLDTVLSLTEEEAEAMVLGEWNAQYVLAHIAGWDTYFTSMAKQLRNGEEVPFRGDSIDEWNVRLVNERARKSWDEIRNEFVSAGEEFLAEYSGLATELWEQPFWIQRKPTPAWVVNHNTGHYQQHLDETHRNLGL